MNHSLDQRTETRLENLKSTTHFFWLAAFVALFFDALGLLPGSQLPQPDFSNLGNFFKSVSHDPYLALTLSVTATLFILAVILLIVKKVYQQHVYKKAQKKSDALPVIQKKAVSMEQENIPKTLKELRDAENRNLSRYASYYVEWLKAQDLDADSVNNKTARKFARFANAVVDQGRYGALASYVLFSGNPEDKAENEKESKFLEKFKQNIKKLSVVAGNLMFLDAKLSMVPKRTAYCALMPLSVPLVILADYYMFTAIGSGFELLMFLICVVELIALFFLAVGLYPDTAVSFFVSSRFSQDELDFIKENFEKSKPLVNMRSELESKSEENNDVKPFNITPTSLPAADDNIDHRLNRDKVNDDTTTTATITDQQQMQDGDINNNNVVNY